MRKTIEEIQETKVSRKITKAKIAKNGGIEVEFNVITSYFKNEELILETSGGSTYAGHQLAHPDALHAFDLMRGHLAIICDQREAYNKTLEEFDDDEESVVKFKVMSFSIGGSGDSEGVSLSGYKKLSQGRVLNLNAPFTKWNDDNDPYEHADELSASIAHCSDEVNKYLDGKIAPSAQQEIEFNPEGGDEPE